MPEMIVNPIFSPERVSELLAKTDWEFPNEANTFSPSQFWDYYTCPECYFNQRVRRIPRMVGADLLIGRGVHKGIHTARTHLMEGRDPVAPNELAHAEESAVEEFTRSVVEGVEESEPGESFEVAVDLTKKYASLDFCRDLTARLVRFGVEALTAYDKEAGVAAVESKVWGLGLPCDEEEAAAVEGAGIAPALPFKVNAYLDVQYRNGAIKDTKTASRADAPDAAAVVQVMMYGFPAHFNGGRPLLGIDQLVKTRDPQYVPYWLGEGGVCSDDEMEYARALVLDVAAQISAGRFPPQMTYRCRYTHGLPSAHRAVSL